MKTVIIYKTFLGTVKQYAKWLQTEIQSDLFKMNEIKGEKLDNYDLFIIMSGTYVGMMPLIRYLKGNWSILKDKKVIAVAIGAAPPDDPWSIRSYKKIPENIRNKIKYFKLPGKIGKTEVEKVRKENLDQVIEYIKSVGI